MSASLANLGVMPIREPGFQGNPIVNTPDLDISILSDDDATTPQVGKDGTFKVENGDGSVDISFGAPPKSKLSEKFDDNLADGFFDFGNCSSDILTEIEDDERSRSEWMDMREEGLKLLGLKIEDPRGDVGNSSAPLEGMSTIRSPALLSACLKFQANARGELLPAAGPVKVVVNTAGGTDGQDAWADILEEDMNIYLTQRAPEYYPDTDRMLFYVGFGGSGFKKVYHCPLRRRPVSESIEAGDLIVNAGATDLRNAKRITHRIVMRDSMVKRLQESGHYKKVSLTQATYQPSREEQVEGEIMGISASVNRPDDHPRTIYECLTERDLGEHPNGMPLPYKIVIDKDSREILEVRRNWVEDDPMYMPINMYVRYPYVEAMGFYCIGLLHILGNTTKALTAAEREALDAGMFASFPGFLYNETVARQETSDFRIGPGNGQRVNTGGMPISQAIMALPYKDVTSGLMQIIAAKTAEAEKLSGTAELPTGEGIQNAPVGTVLAIIDQATKVLDAVHKRIHAAQAEEFRLLKERFREDPEAFWRHNPEGATNWDKETFLQALSMVDLVPVADPNTPTHTHRLMKVTALIQLTMQQPDKFNIDAVLDTSLRMIGFSNPSEFLLPPGSPQQPNPAMLTLQLKQQELALKQQDIQTRAAGDAQKSKMEIVKAQMQAKTDAAETQGKLQIEQARLDHEKSIDGANLAKESMAHMDDHHEAAAKLALDAMPPAPAPTPEGVAQ